jgi:hypothetical protein
MSVSKEVTDVSGRLTTLWTARILFLSRSGDDSRYNESEDKRSLFILGSGNASLYSKAAARTRRVHPASMGFDKYGRILDEKPCPLHRIASVQAEMISTRCRGRKCQNRSEYRKCHWKLKHGIIQSCYHGRR